MQKSGISECDLKQTKDQDMQQERNLNEEMDMLSMRKYQMRSPLHITKNLKQNAKTIKIIKKRREQVQNMAYKEDVYWHLRDTEIVSLMKDIRDLASLTNINLGFFRRRYYITDIALRSVSNGFRQLNSLNSISLDFQGCHLTDERMNSLSDGFRYLTSLTSINLRFEENRNITDAGIKFLTKGLRYLASLTSLNLGFGWCFIITDTGIKNLSDCLRYMTSLNNINLRFECCDRITDTGVKSISKCLGNLNSISSIKICFDGCTPITKAGMKFLTDCLGDLTSLTNINLDFTECGRISSETKDNVKQDLKSTLKFLKYIEIK